MLPFNSSAKKAVFELELNSQSQKDYFPMAKYTGISGPIK